MYHTTREYQARKYINSGTKVVIGEGKEFEITARNGSSNGIAFGSTIQYYFNRIDNALTSSVDLQIQLSALTTTGTPTNPRFSDAVACYLFQRIRFLYNSALIGNEVYPQLLRAWIMTVCPQDEWTTVSAQLGIDTTANRVTAATAAQTLYLPVHWIFRYLQQFPIAFIESDTYCIEFQVQPALANVIEYTGGTNPTFSATISQITMRVETEISPGSCDVLRQIHNSGEQVKMYGLKRGLLFEGNDFIQKQFLITSGSTTAQLPYPELQDKLVKAIIISAHTNSDLAGAAGVANYDNYLNVISNWNILSGSSYVDGTDNLPITVPMIKRDYARRHIPGVNQLYSSNIIVRPFSNNLDFDSLDEGMPGFDGAYDYFGISNQYIRVNFGTVSADTMLFVHVVYARRDVMVDGKMQELGSLIRKPSY